MPKIINAYSGNESLADSLKSLGESMFGDQAKNEVNRQTAKRKAQESDAAEQVARYYAAGDVRNAGAQSLRFNPGATNMGAIGLSNEALNPKATNRSLDIASVGAGHSPHFSVIAGENSRNAATNATSRANNADTNATHITTNAATNTQSGENNKYTADTHFKGEVYKHDTTPYAGYDADGNPAPVTSQAKAAAGGVYSKPLSQDEVKAKLIQRETSGTPGATQNGGASPPGYIHPLVQETLGYGKGAAPYQHMESGAVGQSYDGGKTIDGHPAGPGWVSVTSPEAIGQTRTNAVRRAADAPEPTIPAAPGAAAQDAAATTGVAPALGTHTNSAIGSLPGGPAVIKAITGHPQIAPDTQRARADQDIRNNEVRSVLTAFPGRPSKYSQVQLDQLLPQGPAIGNPATEQQHVERLVLQLRQDRQEAAQLARDPAVSPADAQKYLAHVHMLDRTIKNLQGAPPAAAGAPAPQGGADPLAQARDAISRGAPRDAVIQRLRQNGIDPAGL